MIPFNKPCFTGAEPAFVEAAVRNGIISGPGQFGRKVSAFFQKKLQASEVFLTTSCTAALEMAALLCEFQPGDEVILPAFTHVSTANAFIRAGATLRFADSLPNHPNISVDNIRELINDRTRAIVPVHYMGAVCDMDEIRILASEHDLLVIEDAAHAIGSSYHGRQAGTLGDMAAFSFHETKNLTCGRGGMLVLNQEKFIDKAWRIYEYGTNRHDFHLGKIDKYSWVEVGSSFGISELNAAWLWGQIQHFEEILQRRRQQWRRYYEGMVDVMYPGSLNLPELLPEREHNGHIFYLEARSETERNELLDFLNERNINAVFHYITLHDSPYFQSKYLGPPLHQADRFSKRIIRLPLFYDLLSEEQEYILDQVGKWTHRKD